MLTIVSSGDWHLDWHTAGFSREEDVATNAERAADEARKLKADLFLFLGDLADPDTLGAHAATQFACDLASSLASEGIMSAWIRGNHDVVEDGRNTSTLSALRGVQLGGVAKGMIRVYEEPRADLLSLPGGPLGLVALPYPSRGCVYDPAEFVAKIQTPPADVPLLVAGHLWLRGAEPGSESTDMARGRAVYWPEEILQKRFPNALCVGGHYHRRGKYGNVHIAGSLERLTFGELTHEPGFLVLRHAG